MGHWKSMEETMLRKRTNNAFTLEHNVSSDGVETELQLKSKKNARLNRALTHPKLSLVHYNVSGKKIFWWSKKN